MPTRASCSSPANGRRAFTLVELLVVIGILAVLAGLLLPVLLRSREHARKANCQANLRQIGVALEMYTSDYDDVLPNCVKINEGLGEHPQKMPSLLSPYTRSKAVHRCPSDSGGPAIPTGEPYWQAYSTSYQNYASLDTTLPGASIYGLPWPVPLAAIQDAASTSLLRDATSWHRKDTPWNINVLWADGHVKWFMGNDQDGRAGIF